MMRFLLRIPVHGPFPSARAFLAARARGFLASTRAGATAIAAAAVTVMTVGAAALITDHVWLYDQRDVLKTAAEAASLAANFDLDRRLDADPSLTASALETALEPIAKRYVEINLEHLPPARLTRAKETLEVTVDVDLDAGTVEVEATADLGGTLFSRALPLLGQYAGPPEVAATASVQSKVLPVEVVIAIDMSISMAGGLASPFSRPSRMEIVKSAARDLVAIIEPSSHNQIAVGIVPWSDGVRLGPARASQWQNDGWVETYGVSAWDRYLDVRRVGAWRQRSLPAVTPQALFAPPSTTAFTSALVWRGSRTRSSRGHLEALAPLSTDRTAIDAMINSLEPWWGNTYSALGVLWAQAMLEPGWRSAWGGAVHPADPALPAHAGMRKVIVLLTDGQDTVCARETTTSDCTGATNFLSRADVCTAAKTRGTEIFVIGAMPPREVSADLGNRLRACSSQADRPGGRYVFLNNSTRAALEAAFADVATQLRTLRKVS